MCFQRLILYSSVFKTVTEQNIQVPQKIGIKENVDIHTYFQAF